MTYLQGSARPDMSMDFHQCARFFNDPKLSHERAINRIVKYFIGSSSKVIIYKPDKDKRVV